MHSCSRYRAPWTALRQLSRGILKALSMNTIGLWLIQLRHRAAGKSGTISMACPPTVLPGRPLGLSEQRSPYPERTAWLDQKAGHPGSTRQQAQHSPQDNIHARAEGRDSDRQHAECAAAEDEDPSSDEGRATASSAPRYREQQILPLHGVPSSPTLNSPEAPAPYDFADGAIPSTSAPQGGFERACACSKAPARRLSSLEHVSQAPLDELEALLAQQQREV